MNELIIYIFSGAAVLLLLAVLWYLIQTVRIMWTYNSLLAIAAIVFSPFVHIFFYFMPKNEFNKHESGLFKKYFLSIGLVALLGIVAATQVQNSIENITDEKVSLASVAINERSTQKEKAGYSLGYMMAEGNKEAMQGLNLDTFDKGFRDGYEGDYSSLSTEQMMEALTAYQQKQQWLSQTTNNAPHD